MLKKSGYMVTKLCNATASMVSALPLGGYEGAKVVTLDESLAVVRFQGF